MLNEVLQIWCDAIFEEQALTLLQERTRRHQLYLARSGTGNAPFELAEADIAVGQPDPEAVMAASRLRWIHIASAGYTRYDRDDFKAALQARGAIFTNSSHVYDGPCAQHVLAMMLGLARQLPQIYECQRTSRDWQCGRHRAHSYLLNGQTVLLLGFGAIGRRLAELLAPFDVNIVAVRRSVQAARRVRVVAEAELDLLLPLADHVVNVLPDNASTRGYVSAPRLALMKPGACFYNVGRGTTVDQPALLDALNSGHLGAAYLDVTDPEPLPPTHPLWTAPNCYITPHTAGGHAGEQERLVRHFLSNLAAFERGKPLADRVF